MPPHALARLALVGLVIVVGVAAGVYLGVTLTSGRNLQESRLFLQNQSFVDVGEIFPDYPLWDVTTQESTSVLRVIANSPCILLFVSSTCDMCNLLEGYWAKKVEPALRPEIQIVCVYDSADGPGEEDQNQLVRLRGARRVTTDRLAQRVGDGINATPTLVAVDGRGMIKLVVTGFDRRIGADILNDLL